MELHGTKDDPSIPLEWEGVDALREVSFNLTASEMAILAEFFTSCAREAAGEHFGDFDHRHLRDHLWQEAYSGPDVVVYRSTS